MTTLTLTVTTDYKLYPLICIYCGSTAVIYSDYADDCKCQVCERWQMSDDEPTE